MIQDWDIKPRGTACHSCSQAFSDRQPYFSSLVFGQDGYARADFCTQCWKQTLAGGGTPFSSWQGIYKSPPPEREPPVRRETAESLLRRLMEDEDESQRNIIYILAVMLERNKTLVERDVKTNERGIMVRLYEHRKTGETFLIPDPRLRLDQLASVQQEVITILDGNKAAGAPAPAPAPAPASESAEPK
jgi:hypothetical protein